MKVYFQNLLLYSVWCPMETSHLIQVMVMFSLVLHPTVNIQNTVWRNFQYFASPACPLFRTCCRLINMEAQQQWTRSYNFKTNYTNHQCQTMVMKAQSVMQLKPHALFIFSLDGDMRSVSVSKETAHSNNRWAPETVTTWWWQEVPF